MLPVFRLVRVGWVTRSRLALALVVAALWLVVAATPAGAHADLTATEPAAGEVLASSPNEIVLRFSEGVDPIEGGIRLVRDTGEEVGRFDIQQIEGSVLRVRLEQSLPPAGYVVAWRAVSADSHPIRGAFVFHVGQEPGGDTSALVSRLLSDQGGTPGTGALLAVGRWLSFAGVLLVVGVALLSVWTASLPTPPSARSASGGSVSGGFVLGGLGTGVGLRLKPAARLAAVAGAVGALGSGVMIGAQAVSVSANWSDVVDPGAWWDVAATHSGRWWAARLLVLAAVAVSGALVGSAVRERNGDIGAAFAEPDGAAGLAVELDGVRGLAVEPDGVAGTAAGSAGLRGPGRALWVHAAAAVAAVGLALITALGGHAVSGRWVVLGFVATVAHLLALGFWVTGLMALLSAGRGGRHGRRRGHGRNAAGGGLIAASEVAFATAFSPWALGAVAVVVATGAFNSVRQVGERSLLSSTDYGTVLVTKVLLVAGLIGVAALSRRTLHRACGTATGNVTGAEAEQVIGGQRSAGAGHGVGGVGGGAGEWGSESGVLRRTVVLEVVLFAVVLVAGAVLVNVRPSYSERSGPSSGSATVGQRLAQVVLEPARAGSNELHVYLSSPGGALDRADSITVTATLAEADVGPIDIDVFPAGPNHVTNPSANLPLKGRWSFEVIARFGRFEEVRFTVPLAVSS